MIDQFDAVTLDFHDTLMECDEWFQLEIYDLLPSFLQWLACERGQPAILNDADQSRTLYRKIRKQVLASGTEVDAAGCVELVIDQLGLSAGRDEVDRGLEAIMSPALDSATPMPGAQELVAQLAQAGTRIAVISSAVYHPFLDWALERYRMRDHIEFVLTSASCGIYKSSSAIYHHAAELLGVEPHRCLHIGDSVPFDVASASQAGFSTVLVTWGTRAASDGAAPSLAVDSLVGLGDKLIGARSEMA